MRRVKTVPEGIRVYAPVMEANYFMGGVSVGPSFMTYREAIEWGQAKRQREQANGGICTLKHIVTAVGHHPDIASRPVSEAVDPQHEAQTAHEDWINRRGY